MFFAEPPRSPWDINFVMFGIPVRIAPYFWICGLIFGVYMATPAALLVWMVVFLLSFLIHELGHALAFRSFGYYPMITLYAMGGLTSPGMTSYGARNPGTLGRVLISAAGPGAEIFAALLLYNGLGLAGFDTGYRWGLPYVLDLQADLSRINGTLHLFVNLFFVFSIFWAFVNLLPVYPLDGGQIAREILLKLNSRTGLRDSLMLSCIAGVAVAAFALRMQQWFLALMFAVLAYSSYTDLDSARRGPWW